MEVTGNRLAIIIPYYKKTFFEAALASLAKQTDQRFSVYIGDDASPDNPEEILKKFEGKFSFHYTKFKNNLGGTFLTKQWDRCIALSEKEDWIMILGDDDVLEENTVEQFYKNLSVAEKKGIQVIRLASQLIDDEGNTISKVYENPVFENAAKSYMRAFCGEGRSTLTEHFFTRSAYEKHGFRHFPVAFGSDNVAWLEFSEMGEILSINDSKAFIRISGEHLSSKDDVNLTFCRREGIYLFNRYIVQNYGDYFSKEERFLILKKAYRNLTSSTTNKLKSVNFIIFMTRYISPLRVFQIIRENRHK